MNGIISRRSASSLLGAVAIAVVAAGCDSDAASSRPSRVNVVASVAQDWRPGDPGVIRYQMDAARGRLWALTAAGVDLYDVASRQRLAQIALPDWIWVDDHFACAPDLAIGPLGEAVVSSNVVPTLWRVDPATLAASKHELAIDDSAGRDIGITALAYSPQQRAYFAVSAAHGSLWRVDPRLSRAQSVPLSAPLPKSCTLAAPEFDRRATRVTGVCVRGEEGDWSVAFAPDQRFGYVRAGQCNIQ